MIRLVAVLVAVVVAVVVAVFVAVELAVAVAMLETVGAVYQSVARIQHSIANILKGAK